MNANPPARAGDSAALKDAKLARAKRAATGLLVLAGVLYVAATLLAPRYPLLAYVGATCEAAMVGALADWFAVVALFRHPLNIPLPRRVVFLCINHKDRNAPPKIPLHGFQRRGTLAKRGR